MIAWIEENMVEGWMKDSFLDHAKVGPCYCFTCMTTRHFKVDKELKGILNIPPV